MVVNPNKTVDENKRITCIACGKLIATGGITQGKIKIPCKCGVMNTIGAEMKPEGRRTIQHLTIDVNKLRHQMETERRIVS